MFLGTIVQGVVKDVKKFRTVVDPPEILAMYLQHHLTKCAMTTSRGHLLVGTTVDLSTVLNHTNAIIDLWKAQLVSRKIACPAGRGPISPRNDLVKDIIMNHCKCEYLVNASNCSATSGVHFKDLIIVYLPTLSDDFWFQSTLDGHRKLMEVF